MAASEHLAARQFQQGQCGTYAHTLQQARPELKIGLAGNLEHGPHGDEFPYDHIFAHDDTYAHDSLGSHPLPYKGANNQWNHNELGYKDTNEAGIDPLYEEHGPEGPDESIKTARKVMKHLGQI